MLCVGIIVYSFLKCFGVGLGKKVGIVGIGGFGYYGIIFVKVMGVEVWVIFCFCLKEEDVCKMGVDGFIVIFEKDWNVFYKMIFDFIVNIVNIIDGFDFN